MKTKSKSKKFSSASKTKIRYAVVGLGHIAQNAVLPAFEHAKTNSVLAAFVTGHVKKAKKVEEEYHEVPIFTYDEYETLLDSKTVDAVYIALPNDQHYEYTKKALIRGVHVLCEKPFTLNANECEELVMLSKKHKAKLMVAYRLHFDPANLKAIEIAQSGKLGELKYFNSNFSYPLKDTSNIRAKAADGGGPIWDIGIYCINAARYLFQAEPTEVFAFRATNDRQRFHQVHESCAVTMLFPQDRLASFVCSFGAAATGVYDLFGSKGSLHFEEAYEYAEDRKMVVTVNEKKQTLEFKKTDQFAPELIYFSDCVLTGRQPEPSGLEGWADVKIIQSLFQSMKSGHAVKIPTNLSLSRKEKPNASLKMTRPKIRKPTLHDVKAPHS